MDRTIHALLVGIDTYPNPRHRLNGCVNDVTRMREYLEARADAQAGFRLAPPVVLTDAQATRQAVIAALYVRRTKSDSVGSRGFPLIWGGKNPGGQHSRFGASEEDLRSASKALVRVAVARVEPTSSLVDVGGGLVPAEAYKAVVAALPLPKIGVVFDPPGADGTRLALEALASAQQGMAPSLYVREVGPGAPARFRLRAEGGGYAITSPENDRPLVARIEGQSPATARMAVQRLEHLAKWTLASELQNP
ncbi:MAG TPA: hypothetical protein VF590_18790, partial [Isosphaeraceae bacterium]